MTRQLEQGPRDRTGWRGSVIATALTLTLAEILTITAVTRAAGAGLAGNEPTPPLARHQACPPRYVMPDGVELPKGEEAGVAPANLPGTDARFDPPAEITIDLRLNPLREDARPESRLELDETVLPIGRVIRDRDSGAVSFDGQSWRDRFDGGEGGSRGADPEHRACDGARISPPAVPDPQLP